MIKRLLVSRALRGVMDGTISVLLAGYLARLGLSPALIGVVVTATLLGSGAMTLGMGLMAHRLPRRRLLFVAAALMALTGFGFAVLEGFWALLVVAVVGTLNPSSGDVSVFLPLEQAALAGEAASGPARTGLFARYNVVGTFASALGALAAGVPEFLSRSSGLALLAAERTVFFLYGAVGAVVAWLYAGLHDGPVAATGAGPLVHSRSVVFRLAALFSLDSFGGGFVVQSLLALWLFQRFQLSVAAAGAFFFVSMLASAVSQFLSPLLASRIGLVRTMVYTHVPANLSLIATAFMPSVELALSCLLLRACVSSMDVPARQAYVMAVVPAEERAAAASVTNVPRSLASALAPTFTGLLLSESSFGWPLVIAGILKLAYDLLLLAQFRGAAALGDPIRPANRS